MSSRQAKPAKPMHQALKLTWGLWLLMAAVAYPLAVSISTSASVWAGVGVQLLVLVPAMLCTPAIWRGNSPYALMWVSMAALIYLGVVSMMTLLRYYEQAPIQVWSLKMAEMVLLLLINCQLFMLLKRLPAMHKQHAKPQ